jgi:putative component of toxin-antitoxin plasmid stabilization module
MRPTVITAGTWIIVATIDDRGRCRVRDQMEAIMLSDRVAHAQLLALLGRVAVTGPPKDERRSRPLGDGVFELKTPRGLRLIYFFGRTRQVVCADVCRKPKPRDLLQVVRRARDLREAYLTASADGEIVIEIGG